jgi:membrane-bound lytic murein transglycosylase D
MAITAYNHGLAGVRRAMRQFGDAAYADIMRNYKGRTFGFASRNFYVAFLAAKHVDENVDRYFPSLVAERPIDYSLVKLENYLPAATLGKALGVTERQLLDHNPALQATVWQGSKHVPKDYSIRIPSNLLQQPMPTLMAGVPASDWQTAQLPDLFHTIRRGDTLSQIADTYKTRVATLVALNNLGSAHRIRAGQQLRLPAAGPAPVTRPAEAAPVVAAEPEEAPAPVITAAAPSDLAARLQGTVQTALLSDPSDYGVAADGSIEVHPLETLGHFADWLEIRTQRLRDINGLAFRTPVEVGKRLRLDLAKVDAKTFEDRRVAYHRVQQDSFFREHVISGVSEHVIRSGDSIWVLASRRYQVPMWLFRQYNPAVDPARVAPGTTVRFPVLTDVDSS